MNPYRPTGASHHESLVTDGGHRVRCRFNTDVRHRTAGPRVQSCRHRLPADGEQSIATRHRRWIIQDWSKQPGEAFDFDARFRDYYSSGDDMHLYDDFDPQHRVARSLEAYRAIWAQPFSMLKAADHVVLDGPHVLRDSGDLAASMLEFGARLVAANDAVTGVRARSSMTWRCESGQWRIVREHNSTRRVSREEIERLFAEARTQGGDRP